MKRAGKCRAPTRRTTSLGYRAWLGRAVSRSTLIAEAFESVRYPILPRIEWRQKQRRGRAGYSREMILHIRHHSLHAPCDFDLSPYFEIVKPTIEEGFNYKGLTWADDDDKPTTLGSPIAARASGQHPETSTREK